METVRTFIAIQLSPAVHDTLAQALSALQKVDANAACSVKWVDANNIHLTLKFLGDTQAAQVVAVQAAMAAAATGVPPLQLALTRAGCFPAARQPRIIWIGVGGDLDALGRLQAAVERSVSPLGFPTEARPFSPHLTLGRVRAEAPPDVRQRLGAAALALQIPHLPFTVAEISLMRSDLRPGGPIYTRLAQVALHGAASAPH